MKATLKFNLPEEETEYTQAIHGRDWELVVYKLDQYLHDTLQETEDDTKFSCLVDVKREIESLMVDLGVSFSN